MIEKAKNIAEMAEIYGVSEDVLIKQIEGHESLNNELQKLNFKGEWFFPKQQRSLIKYLGGDDGRVC